MADPIPTSDAVFTADLIAKARQFAAYDSNHDGIFQGKEIAMLMQHQQMAGQPVSAELINYCRSYAKLSPGQKETIDREVTENISQTLDNLHHLGVDAIPDMTGTPLAAFSAQLATAMQNPEVRAAINAIPSRASEVTIPDLCEGFGIASLATPSNAATGTAAPKR